MTLKQMLLDGASEMGIPMTEKQAEQFEAYHALLTEANRRMNLTRVPEDLRESADRNYLDCITPLQCGLPKINRAVDVGSGAGFPGIPLSIMLPETHFVLLDSLNKRVEFLKAVIEHLGLNAEALSQRAEDAGRSALRESFDLAVARAVAPMGVLCELMLPLVRTGGHMLSMKGPGLEEELQSSQAAIQELGGGAGEIFSAKIPGREWDHKIALIPKLNATPDRYPRAAGIPKKRPLIQCVMRNA